MNNIVVAMDRIQKAQLNIRKAIREGFDVDGHLEEQSGKLSLVLDVLDSVNTESKTFTNKNVVEDLEVVGL